MEISKSFVVQSPIDAAWGFLTDPERVAACLPGAAITGRLDEQGYLGTITVKVGPVSATYKGTLRFARLDPVTHTAEMSASGRDTRGKGGADMTMTSRLVGRGPNETEVSVVSQVNVMGVLAQFGRGMIQDVSDQLFDRFVGAMRARLEEAPGAPSITPAVAATASSTSPTSTATDTPAPVPSAAPPSRGPVAGSPPIQVLSFGSAVAGRAVARAARNPVAWAGVAIGLVAGYWLLRRSASHLRRNTGQLGKDTP